MLMECRVPLPSTPDAFDIYYTDINSTTSAQTTMTTTIPSAINGNCSFVKSENGAIFDTGEPYLNRMRDGS